MQNPIAPSRLREAEVKDRCWELFAFVVIDSASVIQRVNGSFEKMFGYVPGELIGWNLNTILSEDVSQIHPDHVGKFFQSPMPRPMTLNPAVEARHKEGHMIRVTVALSSFFDDQHNQYAIACVSEAR